LHSSDLEDYLSSSQERVIYLIPSLVSFCPEKGGKEFPKPNFVLISDKNLGYVIERFKANTLKK